MNQILVRGMNNFATHCINFNSINRSLIQKVAPQTISRCVIQSVGLHLFLHSRKNENWKAYYGHWVYWQNDWSEESFCPYIEGWLVTFLSPVCYMTCLITLKMRHNQLKYHMKSEDESSSLIHQLIL